MLYMAWPTLRRPAGAADQAVIIDVAFILSTFWMPAVPPVRYLTSPNTDSTGLWYGFLGGVCGARGFPEVVIIVSKYRASAY
jgi:hypothetical protein